MNNNKKVEKIGLLTAQGGTSNTPPIQVYSPYSNELIAEVATANAQHIEQALSTAYSIFRDKKKWLTVTERCAILQRAIDLIAARYDSLVATAASEGGKPLVDSQVEVTRAMDGLRVCIETIRHDAGKVIPMAEPDANISRMAFTQKEPIGVVVAVSAFNHPFNLIVHQVAAAVAAGCPTLVKPAGTTPLSCLRFVSILHESGLPIEFCQVLMPEDTALATTMVTDARVGFFSFIGSAKVGWMLRSKLAAGTRCALEHGGSAPLIADATADLNKLLPAILKGGYYHAGQVCVSVQRVFVHESQRAALLERLVPAVQALKVGDPLAASTEVGPLITQAEQQRVHQWVCDATKHGAELLCGGDVLANNCYQPTVLLNPSPQALVSQQEIFGPVVCVYSYDDVNKAIAMANSLEVAFQAAVFAQDIDRALSIAHQLDASAVMVNETTAFRQDAMPFAGLRHSGLGVGGIPYTIEDMQIDKMLVIKGAKFPSA